MSKRTSALLIAFLIVAGASQVSAQKAANGSDYKNAIGLGINFGNGATLVGPSFKHFFTENHVGAAELLFGDGITSLMAYYQYHKDIEGAPGLKWYAGAGAGFWFGNHNTAFALSPLGGLDYKISGAPICFSFDWRPTMLFGNGDSDFEAGRFGMGFRFAF